MHVFLQGERNIGKSTVVSRTIDMLQVREPLVLRGFFTWNGGKGDPHVYMRPAQRDREREVFRIASWDKTKGALVCDLQVFEQVGTSLLKKCPDTGLVVMDELGFLESGAAGFIQAVMDTIAGSVPVLGVLRLGGIPWHETIKQNPSVSLFDVDRENRGTLPLELAERLLPLIFDTPNG